ncbi:MAG: SdrD B-like domain-containing protein, partial [Acidobacteriota bacterium]
QIFYDLNGNGALDVASDTVVETAVTDAFGRYVFERLFPGTYVVSIDDTQPALTGFTHTTADSQAAAGDQLDATLSSADLADLDNDFGYRNTALADISGTVFHDIDRDGFDDGVGEPGLEGVTVELRDASGNPIAKALTDANGDYSFEDLPDGDYTVAVTDERGVLDDYTLTSGLDRRDVTLAGVDVTDIDFGYARENELGRIGDYVWLDANRDGIQDAGESGIPNVTLRLFDAGPDRAIGGGDDVLVATTSTDANGGYAFPGLDDGDYYVDLDGTTLPSGLVATVGTTDPSSLINLGLGEVFLLADFGYGGTSGSSALGDRVWVDVDGDGVQDAGEAGIEGVTVTAVGPSGTFTTTTGPGGFYLFTGLAEGDYTVTVDSSTLPAGLDTAPTNGPASREFAVPANADVLTADFGFDGPALGSIGDFVWLDTDGDGVQDAGELGIEGVTLDLLDASGDVVATMTTDEDGAYDFTGLLAGNYQVRVTDLGGVLDGLNLSGGTNPTGTIALAAGQDFDLADFGYTAAALNGSLGNLVWRDVNGDGDVDSGEPGIGGVTVDLWFDVNG